jgi:hypothetical protein
MLTGLMQMQALVYPAPCSLPPTLDAPYLLAVPLGLADADLARAAAVARPHAIHALVALAAAGEATTRSKRSHQSLACRHGLWGCTRAITVRHSKSSSMEVVKGSWALWCPAAACGLRVVGSRNLQWKVPRWCQAGMLLGVAPSSARVDACTEAYCTCLWLVSQVSAYLQRL